MSKFSAPTDHDGLVSCSPVFYYMGDGAGIPLYWPMRFDPKSGAVDGVQPASMCACCGAGFAGNNIHMMNEYNKGVMVGWDIDESQLKPAKEARAVYDHFMVGNHKVTLKLNALGDDETY